MCFYSYYRILNAKNQLKVLILNNLCWFYRHYSIVWLFKISYGPYYMNHIIWSIWNILYGPSNIFYMVYTPEYRCFCIFDDPGSLVLDSSSAQVQHQTRKKHVSSDWTYTVWPLQHFYFITSYSINRDIPFLDYFLSFLIRDHV